jgi:hypothetical protein
VTRYEAVKAAVRKFEDAPFTYGNFDCCEFVREVATLYRGADPAPELVYMDEMEANDLIANFGGLSSLMTYVFGDPIEPEDTNVGDALKLKLPKVGDIMGVRVPDGALVPVMRGLHKVPLRYALEGWRI